MMVNFFNNIYNYLGNNKLIRFGLLIFCFIFVLFFSTKISLNEDISGFLPNNDENARLNFVYKNIGIADKIIISISDKDSTKTIDKDRLIESLNVFVSTLDSISANNNLIKSMFYKVDQQEYINIIDSITNNIPYYLSEKDYIRLDSILNKESIAKILENNKKY